MSAKKKSDFRLLPGPLMAGVFLVLGFFTGQPAQGRFLTETSFSNPCIGRYALLAVLDRPTVADSSCTVRPGHVVIEAGYAHETLYPTGSGRGWNAPEMEIRFGLPHDNEFVLLPPNRVVAPGASGYTASVIGLKHEFDVSPTWQFAAESLVTLPSGDPNQGSAGTGVAINGVASYSPSSTVGLSLMAGFTSETEPSNLGGGRYTSFNPDGVVTWEFLPPWQLYFEVYGATHTGVGQGSGYDADGGIQILLNRNIEIDFEAGTRLTGNLGGYSHYIGTGLGLEF